MGRNVFVTRVKLCAPNCERSTFNYRNEKILPRLWERVILVLYK